MKLPEPSAVHPRAPLSEALQDHPLAGPGIDLHAALRSGTRAQHLRIESALALQALADEPQAVQRYGRLLQAFALFQRHWQPRVQAALPLALQGWLDASPRAGWLAQDLAALGLAAPAGHLPDPTESLVLADVPAALASLYVLEGSALGGQVIVRALAHQAPALARRACRYFEGHGAHTGAHWRAFCAVLSEHAPRGPGAGAQLSGAVHSANATFAALLRSAQLLQATVEAGVPVTA